VQTHLKPGCLHGGGGGGGNSVLCCLLGAQSRGVGGLRSQVLTPRVEVEHRAAREMPPPGGLHPPCCRVVPAHAHSVQPVDQLAPKDGRPGGRSCK